MFESLTGVYFYSIKLTFNIGIKFLEIIFNFLQKPKVITDKKNLLFFSGYIDDFCETFKKKSNTERTDYETKIILKFAK